ncbi:MAG: hypothetical protein JO072_03685, partial [Parafilimonas sp.]|nr:hypothetical protein [Parafilimonas sp.]
MSIRAYRLLRNNKEEGPFTAEELVYKNLKPYDLIWVDGRSAAWRYPGELAEFKNLAPLPGEENVDVQNIKTVNAPVSSSVQAAVAVNDTIVEPHKKQKPRYKVSAAWSKIQTVTAPVYSDVTVAEPKKISASKIVDSTVTVAKAKSLSWEEAWMDWEKEKVIPHSEEPAKIKPVPVSKAKTINEGFVAPVLETKFAQPLDDLKDKYIENLLYQKQSKKGISLGRSSEFVIPSLALIIIFSVGYWLLNGSNKTTQVLSTKTPQAQQKQKTENTNTIPANTAATEPGKNIADQNENNQAQNVHDNPSENEAAITDK